MQGNLLMLKLNQLLKEAELANNCSFVHIVLTDGADNKSSGNLASTIEVMELISKGIQVKALKIIIIGVGVYGQA